MYYIFFPWAIIKRMGPLTIVLFEDNCGASRLDRIYTSKNIYPIHSRYIDNAFSDHKRYITMLKIDNRYNNNSVLIPKPSFKIKPNIIDNETFPIHIHMRNSNELLKKHNYNIIEWWEVLVKPGIKKLAQKRSREITRTRKEELNLLRLRQVYLDRKIVSGET